MRILKMQK